MKYKEEIRILLDNYFVRKDNNPEDYQKIKRNIRPIREFAFEKLGCDIILTNDFVKLEKIPSKIDDTYKIESFDNRKDYIFFILIIMYLEDKTNNEQFILSNLITFVKNTLASFDSQIIIDFNDYATRKSLADVIKFTISLGALKILDGSEDDFVNSIDGEALYESTGLSKYIVRQFKESIFDLKTPQDFLEKFAGEDELAKKRNYVYRSLLFYPAMTYKGVDKDYINYLINIRSRIQADLNEIFDGELLIFNNVALLTSNEICKTRVFPNSRKGLHDIILLINHYLALESNLEMSELEFKELLKLVRKENDSYFNKEFRSMKDDKFLETIKKEMISYGFLTVTNTSYTFHDTIYLMEGEYQKKEEQKIEQISLEVE